MDYQKIERDVFEMMNKVRAQPRILIEDLRKMLEFFQGNTYKDPVSRINIITNEGPQAVQEAIAFLQTCSPAPPVMLSKGLTQAGRDHAYDIGPKGEVSHTGSDGSTMSERMERYGQWNRAIAENISFSEKTGKDIIIQFIIDDGNASRGHRKNLFNPDYLLVGIACGYHKGYEVCCVMDLAAEYEDELEKKTGGKKTAPAPQAPQQSSPNYGGHQGGSNYNEYNEPDRYAKPQHSHNYDDRPSNTYQPNTNTYQGGESYNNKNPNVPFDEDEEWPDGAVKCQVKKVTKTAGRKRIKSVIKVFTMKDGNTEIHEYTTEELI